VESAYLVEDYELSQRAFDSVIKIFSKECGSVAKKITSDLNELRKELRQKVYPAAKATSTSLATSSSRTTRSAASSPSKSSMKGKSTDASSSKTTALKRVVSFNQSKDDDEDMSPPETPTKKRKLDSISIKTTALSSTGKAQDLSAFEAAISGRNAGDNGASALDAASTTHFYPGPSTPHRTPDSARQNQIETAERETAMEVDPPPEYDRSPSLQTRRFRPIFLDRKQWFSRDPRVAREWPAMIEHKRRMVDLYGHPFAAQIPDFRIQET
jgi:hypothetical protein